MYIKTHCSESQDQEGKKREYYTRKNLVEIKNGIIKSLKCLRFIIPDNKLSYSYSTNQS